MAEAEVVKKRPFELSFSIGDSYAGFEDVRIPSDVSPILVYAKTVYHNGVDQEHDYTATNKYLVAQDGKLFLVVIVVDMASRGAVYPRTNSYTVQEVVLGDPVPLENLVQ